MSTGGGAARRGPVLASSGGAGSSTGSSGVVPALPAGRRDRLSAGRAEAAASAAAEEGFERSVVEDGLQGERGRDEDVARAQVDAAQGGLDVAAAEGRDGFIAGLQALEAAVAAQEGEAGPGLGEIDGLAADDGGRHAGAHLLAGEAAPVPLQQRLIGAAQGTQQAAADGEPVLEEDAADGVQSLGAQLFAFGAGGLGDDVEVDVRLVQAAALEGAPTGAKSE